MLLRQVVGSAGCCMHWRSEAEPCWPVAPGQQRDAQEECQRSMRPSQAARRLSHSQPLGLLKPHAMQGTTCRRRHSCDLRAHTPPSHWEHLSWPLSSTWWYAVLVHLTASPVAFAADLPYASFAHLALLAVLPHEVQLMVVPSLTSSCNGAGEIPGGRFAARVVCASSTIARVVQWTPLHT